MKTAIQKALKLFVYILIGYTIMYWFSLVVDWSLYGSYGYMDTTSYLLYWAYYFVIFGFLLSAIYAFVTSILILILRFRKPTQNHT